jgi:ribonuclease-3
MTNDDENLMELEKVLGVHFRNQKLLLEALTHRSYLNEYPEPSLEHNERLEFLGDAVLELLVSEYLYKNFKKPEGEMTNLRAALVNAKTLANVAKNLYIENYLLLSKGEKNDTSRAREALLANALEAIIGAIYLDQGIESAGKFIEKNILSLLPRVLKREVIKDAKSRFQEVAQEKFGITPDYKVLKEWGPDHQKQFQVGAYLEKKLIAQGQGFSIKEAEEEAAKKALRALKT